MTNSHAFIWRQNLTFNILIIGDILNRKHQHNLNCPLWLRVPGKQKLHPFTCHWNDLIWKSGWNSKGPLSQLFTLTSMTIAITNITQAPSAPSWRIASLTNNCRPLLVWPCRVCALSPASQVITWLLVKKSSLLFLKLSSEVQKVYCNAHLYLLKWNSSSFNSKCSECMFVLVCVCVIQLWGW